ncbi:MAG: DUF4175 family protein [Myxococcales bacterium]
MGELERIRGFLEAIRRRFLLRDLLRWGAFAGSAFLVLLLLLAVSASHMGPAGFWFPLTLLVAGGCVLAALFGGVWRPSRLLRGDRTARRLVARLRPTLGALGGDIISAIELGQEPPPRVAAPLTEAEISVPLVRAFHGRVAEALQPLDPVQLISMRPVVHAAAALLAAALLVLASATVAPQVIGGGLSTLFHRPNRFEGAAVSAKPIVGDVRITYDYPAYTGLARRTIEGSTGDIVAVKGTRVKIETAPLHTSRHAVLLLGEAGEDGELPARLAKGTLTAHVLMNESGVYRFWLQPLIGRAVREQRSHHIEVEVDRPPRVEIHGPADRLELPTPRPIEIGFAADDDYGLANVELVFRVDDAPEQRQLLKDAHGARVAQGRTLWDPARLNLSPGARIAYHVEARDRDEISGAKTGISRTLYVLIARPEESIDTRLGRQREVLERLTGDLADRLEIPARGGGAAISARSGGGTSNPAGEPSVQESYLAVHEAEEGHVALLGRLVDDDRRDGSLGKSLRAVLSGMAERLGKLLRAEKEALGKAGATPGGTAAAAASRSGRRGFSAAKVDAQREEHIAELEKDVLLLDDLIGRQRLEDLAAMGRELTAAHNRLKDLLNRYAATKDEALRRQLEREVRELRARIAELAQKIATLKSRNEVPDEWRNLPDTKNLAERAKKLDDLLAEGDPAAMSKALEQLGKDLNSLRQMLDENAEGFGAERFPQENRVVADLMKKIGDLEGDERSLAGETQALSEKQEAETDKRLRGQLGDWTRKENEKVDRLRQKLGQLKTGDPESALSEEVERARESTRQLKRLFAERDLAEAKDEANRAAASLDRATEHLDEDDPGRKVGEPSSSAGGAGNREVGEARALAQEIADDVRKLLPTSEETLTPEERERGRAQAQRQGAIGDRTDETAREAGKRLGKVPGLERAQEDLRSASEQMRQAAEHLRKSEAKQASGAENNAAERLAKLRDAMQERSTGGSKSQRDPVRIPGADESSAPRAWRQELLDAMKEKAPEHFRDDVRRYYEELVR